MSHPVADLVWPLSSSSDQSDGDGVKCQEMTSESQPQFQPQQQPQEHAEWLQLLRRTRASAVREAPAVIAALTARGWNIDALAWPDEGVRARWDRAAAAPPAASTASASASTIGSISGIESGSVSASASTIGSMSSSGSVKL